MKCPGCQFENPTEALFCMKCGAKLERKCPHCGTELPEEALFCMKCGERLIVEEAPPKELSFDEKLEKIQRYLPKGLTEKILSQRDKIEGERKQVTVMFCDMEGFTSLSENLGAEEAYTIMDKVYEILIHKVHDFEGTVNEMTGDGIVALFGAPIALEDAPQRAIRSALAIHREMVKFSDSMKSQWLIHPIKMRVGINTGPVVVGTLGNDLRVEFKAVGDTVNLASRMEEIAEPGTTYVSEDTFTLTEGLFRFEGLGDRKIKGKEKPINIYRVLAPSTSRTRFDVGSERGLTPFIGRERELELLLDGFERAKSGRGQAFSVVAEAGVGKSRLLYELRKTIANENITFLEGKCLSYTRNVPYHPMIDILKSNFKIVENDRYSDIKEKVKLGLKTLETEESAFLSYFLELISVKESGIDQILISSEAKKTRTMEALKQIVLKGSELRPLILAVEDLHWIDNSSEESLKYLLKGIPAARVLLIFTYRPEFVQTWGGRSYHSQVNLNRLSNRESLMMVSHLLGTEEVDSDLENIILEKTEGVPFFVEEFIKSLKDLNAIEEKDNKLCLAEDLQDVVIPSRIQDVIMARVDSLPEGAKEVLQLGSVIGREIGHKLLKQVIELPEEKLLSHLSILKDSELLYERGIYPDSTYVFKHALTQESIYQSLLKNTHQKYHGKIAETMEHHFPETADTQPETVGHHFKEAGLIERAIPYIHRAGERAVQRSANVEAIEQLKKGIELIKALSDSRKQKQQELMLCITLGQVYTVTKGFAAPEIEQVYTRAQNLCQQVGNLSDLFKVLHGLWVFYQSRAKHRKAKDLAEQLLRLAESQHDYSLLMQAYCTLGVSFHYLGELSLGLEHLEKGLKFYDSNRDSSYSFVLGKSDPKVFYNLFVVRILWLLGYPDQSLQKSQEMLALAYEFSHQYTIVEALVGVTRSHTLRREDQQTREHAEALISLAHEQGFSMRAAQGLFFQGWALAVQGHQKQGITTMHQSLATWQASGVETHIPDFLASIAEIYGKRGQIQEGLQTITKALNLIKKTEERWWEAEIYRLKGELLILESADNQSDAESCFNQALDVSRRQQAKSLELRATMSLSRLWQYQGKKEEARRLLSKIYGWFIEGFDTADLKDAKALLDELS